MEVNGIAAIVTGGGTGMGAAAAEALSAAGAKVTVFGRREDVVKAQAGKIGGLGIACDVSDGPGLTAAFAAAREAHGPARVLINAAGIGPFAPVVGPGGEPTPLDFFENVIAVNLTGTYNATRLAAADMMKMEPLESGERGVIIHVSSMASQDGANGAVAYGASKGGVDAMTLAMAREFGDSGIRVVTISPGPVETPLMENVPDELRAGISNVLVFPKRLGSVGEFAGLAMHICKNTFINGEIIRFDAGLRAPYASAPAE